MRTKGAKDLKQRKKRETKKQVKSESKYYLLIRPNIYKVLNRLHPNDVNDYIEALIKMDIITKAKELIEELENE